MKISNLSILLIACLTIALSILAAAMVFGEQPCRIVTAPIMTRIYTEPDLEAPISGHIFHGEIVRVVSQADQFTQVQSLSYNGYAPTQLLKPAKCP